MIQKSIYKLIFSNRNVNVESNWLIDKPLKGTKV